MTDDRGVLGNLPRSRPGQRSAKRAGKPAGEGTAEAASPSAKAASRAGRSGSKAAAAGERQEAPSGGDPIGGAIRGVTGLAATGARVAGGVAREVLRRLPRR
jgi:hypothetical protein